MRRLVSSCILSLSLLALGACVAEEPAGLAVDQDALGGSSPPPLPARLSVQQALALRLCVQDAPGRPPDCATMPMVLLVSPETFADLFRDFAGRAKPGHQGAQLVSCVTGRELTAVSPSTAETPTAAQLDALRTTSSCGGTSTAWPFYGNARGGTNAPPPPTISGAPSQAVADARAFYESLMQDCEDLGPRAMVSDGGSLWDKAVEWLTGLVGGGGEEEEGGGGGSNTNIQVCTGSNQTCTQTNGPAGDDNSDGDTVEESKEAVKSAAAPATLTLVNGVTVTCPTGATCTVSADGLSVEVTEANGEMTIEGTSMNVVNLPSGASVVSVGDMTMVIDKNGHLVQTVDAATGMTCMNGTCGKPKTGGQDQVEGGASLCAGANFMLAFLLSQCDAADWKTQECRELLALAGECMTPTTEIRPAPDAGSECPERGEDQHARECAARGMTVSCEDASACVCLEPLDLEDFPELFDPMASLCGNPYAQFLPDDCLGVPAPSGGSPPPSPERR